MPVERPGRSGALLSEPSLSGLQAAIAYHSQRPQGVSVPPRAWDGPLPGLPTHTVSQPESPSTHNAVGPCFGDGRGRELSPTRQPARNGSPSPPPPVPLVSNRSGDATVAGNASFHALRCVRPGAARRALSLTTACVNRLTVTCASLRSSGRGSNIKVVVRIRPLSDSERSKGVSSSKRVPLWPLSTSLCVLSPSPRRRASRCALRRRTHAERQHCWQLARKRGRWPHVPL